MPEEASRGVVPTGSRPAAARTSQLRLVAALALALTGCAAQPMPDTPALSLAARLRLSEAMDRTGGGSQVTLELLRAETQRSPNDPDVWEMYAARLEQAGRFAEAADAMRRAIALRGPTAGALIALGRLELRVGNGARAAEQFEQALRLEPTSAEAFGGLGLAHDLEGRHDLAQAAYRNALALAPANWTYRSNLALSYLVSGDARRASETLQDAAWQPTAPRTARHNLALILTSLGQRTRAVSVLSSEMGPDDARRLTDDMAAFADWLRQARSPATARGPVPASSSPAPIARTANPAPRADPARAAPAVARSAPAQGGQARAGARRVAAGNRAVAPSDQRPTLETSRSGSAASRQAVRPSATEEQRSTARRAAAR